MKELEERLTLALQENRPAIERRHRTPSEGRRIASSSSFEADMPPPSTSLHIKFDKDPNILSSRKKLTAISQSGAKPKEVKFNENGMKWIRKINIQKQLGEKKMNERSSQACVVM